MKFSSYNLLIELRFSKAIQSGNKNKLNRIILVESNQFETPFSFFNYLVYNKSVFTEEELQSILTHESVHIKQFHSIDVIISKLLTILLWINPITWYYRKAILQNLEFIADAETTKALQNTFNYQKTLLKTVCNQNQLSITNQFYQSLIKKRIVMLNTNPSKKRNAWKYSLILPVIVAFFLMYQVETIAQVRESKPNAKTALAVEVVHFLITKNTTDTEIKNETASLKTEHGIDLKVSKVKRNTSNEIIGLSISYKDKEGNKGQLSKMTDNPIEPILFYKEKDENGKGKIGFGDQEMVNLINHSIGITWEDANQLNTQSVGTIKTDKGSIIYIVNGKKYTEQELENLDIDYITVDGTIDYKADEDSDDKIIVFNGKSSLKVKNNDRDEIKIITKNSAGVSDDAEIYINGKKATKADLDKLETEEIERINISKNEHLKKIEIEKVKAEIEKARAEMEKAKVEIEKSKAEIEKTKAEIEKSRAEEKMKEELKKNN